jgi:hypothetical protein
MTRCLSSLACFLTLTFAIMIAPVAAQTPALTPDVLSKMLDYIARDGTDREVPADVPSRLGLSGVGQVWPSRQAGLKDLLLTLTSASKDKVDVYRIRRDGTLVTAVSLDAKRQFIERDRAETQKGLDAELVYWSTVKASE